MNKINYKDYLKTDYWKNIREQVYERDNHKCRLCNSDKDICVHHRTYENLGEEDLNELITLCKSCHSKFHGKTKNGTKTELIKNQVSQKEEKEKIKYYKFIEENYNIFQKVFNNIETNNYILYGDFYKLLRKMCKQNYNPFHLLCYFFEYYDLVCAARYNENAIDKYNFPQKQRGIQKNIIIKYKIYSDNYNDITVVHHTIV